MKKLREARKGVKEGLKKAQGRVAKTVRPGFWKKALLAMHPKAYSELSNSSFRKSMGYIFALLFASFIIMAIIAMPKVMLMPEYIQSELSKFDRLNITIESDMSEPVRLTEGDSQIIIDTTGETEELGSAKVLITEDYLFYRPYGRTRAYNISNLAEITEHKEEVSNALTFIAILLIPSILITAYVMFLIKYLITILAAAFLLFIAVRLIKKDLSLRKSFATALYAATPMVLIEVVFIPFNSKYLIQLFQFMGMSFYLITLILYILLMVFAAPFAMKGKAKKGEEYPEMEKIEWDF